MRRIMAAAVAVALMIPVAFSYADTEPQPDLGLNGVRAAVLMDVQSGAFIYGERAEETFPIAGVAKLPAILTLAQSFDDGSIAPDIEMQTSRMAAGITGPTAFLEAGETLKAAELLKAAVMISAGDAIMTLGENAYGSEAVFLDNIHATLREAGLESAPSSVLGAGELYTAEQLARLGALAASSSSFLQCSALYMDEIAHPDGRTTELVNANRLVRSYGGCSGLMTGSSQPDGYSGVFYTKRNGTALIAVVIGAKDAAARSEAAVKLLDYGYANFRSLLLADAGSVLAPDIPVRGGQIRTLDLVAKEQVSVLIRKTQGKLTESRSLPEYLAAPLSTTDAVGIIEYTDEAGQIVASVQLYPSEAVIAFGITDILKQIARDFISG